MNKEDRAMEAIQIRHEKYEKRILELRQEAEDEAEILVKDSDSMYYFANMANLTEAIDNVKDSDTLKRLEFLLCFENSAIAELLRGISIKYNIEQCLGDMNK